MSKSEWSILMEPPRVLTRKNFEGPFNDDWTSPLRGRGVARPRSTFSGPVSSTSHRPLESIPIREINLPQKF